METIIDVKGLDRGTDATRVVSMHIQSIINTGPEMTWPHNKNHW